MAPVRSDRQLVELDAAIAQTPLHAELRYHRAAILAALGRLDAAKADYLAAIAADPTHFGALNDLGTLLYQTDFRSAARLTYAEAVRHHPDNPLGRINLANALLANGQMEDARREFAAALRLAPDDPDAHQGMANLLQQEGRCDEAEQHRQRSYRSRTVTHLPYRGVGEPCRVLLLVSAVGGNVPTRFVFDDTRFAVTIVVAEAWPLGEALPPHDVIFNAIGDADICRAALDTAEAILADAKASVINRPTAIIPTGRADNARRLHGLPHTVAPKVIATDRAQARAAASALGYPLLIRSPGFHTGQHFHKVHDGGELDAARQAMPTDALLLIEYLDARDALGRARKYRVMMIDGALFPLHLAISDDWKVHYFTADMVDRPDHRAEEAAFLEDMAGTLGPKAMAALKSLSAALGLDYAGVDFGLAADGALLLFEANATMVINPPGPEPIWDYRRPAIARALAAAQAMVMARARHAAPGAPPPDTALQIG